jgi:4-diphosphocytidyl-2-C-methyl-D-erythritol kinase
MRDLFKCGEEDAALSCSFNRLEEVVLAAYPEVAALKQRLCVGGAMPVLVSGSGPTVFGVVRDAEMAQRLASSLAETGIRAVACRTLDTNPMLISVQ